MPINKAFHVRGLNPARDQMGCSPPLGSPFNGTRSKLPGIFGFNSKVSILRLLMFRLRIGSVTALGALR